MRDPLKAIGASIRASLVARRAPSGCLFRSPFKHLNRGLAGETDRDIKLIGQPYATTEPPKATEMAMANVQRRF